MRYPFDKNRRQPVLGRRSDGRVILSIDDLPYLPIPRKIVIMDTEMQIDEWVFSLQGVWEALYDDVRLDLIQTIPNLRVSGLNASRI